MELVSSVRTFEKQPAIQLLEREINSVYNIFNNDIELPNVPWVQNSQSSIQISGGANRSALEPERVRSGLEDESHFSFLRSPQFHLLLLSHLVPKSLFLLKLLMYFLQVFGSPDWPLLSSSAFWATTPRELSYSFWNTPDEGEVLPDLHTFKSRRWRELWTIPSYIIFAFSKEYLK